MSKVWSECGEFVIHVQNSIEHEPKMWDNLKGQFMNHIVDVNEVLRDAGMPELSTP